MFSVSVDKQHRTFLSGQYCSDLKKVFEYGNFSFHDYKQISGEAQLF